MKTANVAIMLIRITCPVCDEAVYANNGSELIEESDREGIADKYMCACGCEFRVPRWPKVRRMPVDA